MDKIAQFCQNCLAANEPGETSCYKCGTRLMIVTFPSSLRHEEDIIPPSYYEDHLLERVSLLEFRLKQVSEQLAMAYEIISRQSDFFEKDQILIASFMEAVAKVEPKTSERLAEEMADAYARRKSEKESENKRKKNLEEILSNHQNPNTELFTHLVKEGVRLLEQNEEKQAFRTLERASLLSPENIPLQLFIAEKLFVADKFDAAKKYLESIYKIAPQNTNALLLLGAIYANEYKSEKARKMLSVLAGFPKTMVCANYIWGMLAASEENWKEAIVAFKESVEVSDLPEINYLVGSAYFETKDFVKAIEYLEKAVIEDSAFADAWFMISITCENFNESAKAENARQMAFEAREAGAKSLKYLNKKNSPELKNALPFLHLNEDKKRLLTNGSLRMTRFFRKLVFEAFD